MPSASQYDPFFGCRSITFCLLLPYARQPLSFPISSRCPLTPSPLLLPIAALATSVVARPGRDPSPQLPAHSTSCGSPLNPLCFSFSPWFICVLYRKMNKALPSVPSCPPVQCLICPPLHRARTTCVRPPVPCPLLIPQVLFTPASSPGCPRSRLPTLLGDGWSQDACLHHTHRTPLCSTPPTTRSHPPRTRNRIRPATTSTPKGPPGPPPGGTVTRPVPPAASAAAPLRGRSKEGGGLPPPQYQAAPREAPKDPLTPPDWPGTPRDEARSRKQQRSRSPFTRRTHPRRSRSPQRHRASAAHSRHSRSLMRHQDPPGPRTRRSRSPRRRRARHRRPMSTSPSPRKQHRVSSSPRRP